MQNELIAKEAVCHEQKQDLERLRTEVTRSEDDFFWARSQAEALGDELSSKSKDLNDALLNVGSLGECLAQSKAVVEDQIEKMKVELSTSNKNLIAISLQYDSTREEHAKELAACLEDYTNRINESKEETQYAIARLDAAVENLLRLLVGQPRLRVNHGFADLPVADFTAR